MPPVQVDSTHGPSRPQLIYSVPTFMEAAEQANLDRIREHLQTPLGAGRPPLDRDPMIKLYLASRSRRTEVPDEMTPLLERLETDHHGLATLCGFDHQPSRSTLRTVFLELDGLKNEVRLTQADIGRLLKRKDGKPKRDTKGKPRQIVKGRIVKDRRKRRRNPKKANAYRKMRLTCALGVFQFEELIPDEEAAEAFIVDARWPDGVVRCPKPNCGTDDVVEVRRRKHRTWRCLQCERRFHALTHTTLKGVHGSWRALLLAGYFCLQFPYQSALSLACALKTDGRTRSHRTSLRLVHRIFEALEVDLPAITDDFQTDDTLIGNVDGIPVTVIGCVSEETGRLVAGVIVGEVELANSTPFIEKATDKNARMMSDESNKLPWGIRTRLTVNHKKKQYVRWYEEHHKLATTNSMESFWAALKLLLHMHRSLTLRHLYLYVAAAAWHIGNLSVPVVDQMKAVIRNAQVAWLRPAREIPEELLDFQMELQASKGPAEPKPARKTRRPLKVQTPLPETKSNTKDLADAA